MSRNGHPFLMHTTTPTRVGLAGLVARIRAETQRHTTAEATSRAVARLLTAPLPSIELLSPDERRGDDTGFVRHTLHAEAGFSIAALVWRPGQLTPIHDHVAWCAFVVLQGVEFETLYRDDGDRLTEIGRAANHAGDASGFAPPGDIHRVHNTGESTAISLHVYGADLGHGESSVRRVYDLPVSRRGLAA